MVRTKELTTEIGEMGETRERKPNGQIGTPKPIAFRQIGIKKYHSHDHPGGIALPLLAGP